MSNKLTAVTYHFVRDIVGSKWPNLKGINCKEFNEQIRFFRRNYNFVSFCDLIDCLDGGELPSKAIILTFDEGFKDHYNTVFPILHEAGIQGFFFPNGKAILEKKILDVNAIKFILNCAPNIELIFKDLYRLLDEYRDEFNLDTNDQYYKKYAKNGRYDGADVVFIKRMLQHVLDEKIRHQIVETLFSKYVTSDEESFANQIYVNTDELKTMVNSEMYVGSHGYDHHWLSKFSAEDQEKDIDLSIDFLKSLGSPTDRWIMCYPYGIFNRSLIDILKKKNCSMAFSTKQNITALTRDNAYTLERLDTNDFPKKLDEPAGEWAQMIMNS